MATPTTKRTTSPAFQFYPSDFLNSPKVRRMSLTERGAYITLLSLCWMDGGTLSTDVAELAGELHVPVKQFERMWAGLLSQCFYEKNGRLRNDRLDRETKKQDEYRQRQSDAATKKWDRKRVSQADAVALPTDKSLSSSSSSSSSSVRTTTTATRGAPIHQRRNLNAAWEGSRGLYVVQGQHQKFVALLNSPTAELQLFAWYGEVAREWTDGPKASLNPGTDMVKFWDARHAERWPPALKATGTHGRIAPGDAWRPEGQ